MSGAASGTSSRLYYLPLTALMVDSRHEVS